MRFSIVFTALFALVLKAAPSLQLEVIDIEEGTVHRRKPVTYDVTFVGNWTKENHPKMFPSNPHWSPPVIATHNRRYKFMWRRRKFASTGVKNVAETGSTAALNAELKSEQNKGNVWDIKIGRVQYDKSQVIKGLSLNRKNKRISMITMIAPSPDWFAGIDKFVPMPKGGNKWYDKFTVLMQPYDAGTDGGRTYGARDVPLDKPMRVKELTVDNTPDGLLVNNGEIRPVAYAVFERVK